MIIDLNVKDKSSKLTFKKLNTHLINIIIKYMDHILTGCGRKKKCSPMLIRCNPK